MKNSQKRLPVSTDRQIAKLRSEATRYSVTDKDLRGHYVRVTPEGNRTFYAVARGPDRKQIWAKIGSADVLNIDEARARAREALKRIRDGLTPFEAPPLEPDSFKAVADNYLTRHVRAKGLRSEADIVRYLATDIFPHWANLPFAEIRRSDVTTLLDTVEDRSGAPHADHVLAIVSGIMRWYESRTDDYVVPLARGMRRTDSKARSRVRVLEDEEIRTVWKVAEDSGTYGAIIQILLLTAQRRQKVAAIRWQDINFDTGVWTIATEEREKGNAGILKLPSIALEIIAAQPRASEYVFMGRTGNGHFCGWSPSKRRFSAKVTAARDGEPMPNWTLHDLRRTARSLMSRCGVQPNISERVMGHAIEGVEGVYDRHSYLDEKAGALASLASLVERIINPADGKNIVEIRALA